MSLENEFKAIKMLQDDAESIDKSHQEISASISSVKERLANLAKARNISLDTKAIENKKQEILNSSSSKPLEQFSVEEIYSIANERYKEDISIDDILTSEDKVETEKRVNSYIIEFNKIYNLDGWDYAIAGGCGLVATLLDFFCVKAPPKPTTSFTNQVDGIFNQAVQSAFNKILPPELSDRLSNINTIGSADISIAKRLIGAPSKTVSPINHRIRELSHDPVMGVIFGILDMMSNTTTVVNNGTITSYSGLDTVANTENVFRMIGRMFGHLLSDVNAPSANGNRGMGLPAPFMGLLRMFNNLQVGDSTFDKQVEYMYVKGYDFRQFVTTSIPCIIMEVLMRVFWAIKQKSINNVSIGDTLLDTMPFRIHPRFRTMLTIGYGIMCGCNAGKIYISKNIMDLNYAAWMNLIWNSFHSLKWALYDKQFKKWSCIEQIELNRLLKEVQKIEELEKRAEQLPC